MIHLALDQTGRVLAAFVLASDAAEFCARYCLCHVPFNAGQHPAPVVGSLYRA